MIEMSYVYGTYSIVKMNKDQLSTYKLFEDDLLSITVTEEEVSLVIKNFRLKEKRIKYIGIEEDYKCIKINGKLDFSEIGIISKITQILAKAQISVFVMSTFDTDYFLMKKDKFNIAIDILKSNGIGFDDSFIG